MQREGRQVCRGWGEQGLFKPERRRRSRRRQGEGSGGMWRGSGDAGNPKGLGCTVRGEVGLGRVAGPSGCKERKGCMVRGYLCGAGVRGRGMRSPVGRWQEQPLPYAEPGVDKRQRQRRGGPGSEVPAHLHGREGTAAPLPTGAPSRNGERGRN